MLSVCCRAQSLREVKSRTRTKEEKRLIRFTVLGVMDGQASSIMSGKPRLALFRVIALVVAVDDI